MEYLTGTKFSQSYPFLKWNNRLLLTGMACILFFHAAPAQVLHPLENTETLTREIEVQDQRLYKAGKVMADNRFPGARLNDFTYLGNGRYSATIRPENEPINMSPWYAFRLWSRDSVEITIELEYEEFSHRYYPKISRDGKSWEKLDSTHFEFPDSIHSEFTLTVGPDTVWIAAQEIQTHADALAWCDTLARHTAVNRGVYGRSIHNRELPYLDIFEGNPKDRDLIVLLSRQHPPEVTGYKAFQAFVETLLDSSSLATAFRQKYRVLALPILNPDGVDMGHWRHNAGGVDLNRDWGYYRQKETDLASSFIVGTAKALSNQVILGIDFHSTWSDIYYTLSDPGSQTLPGYWRYWTDAISYAIPGYNPRINASMESRDVSKIWFYEQFGAEGITFEIGDNTEREFIELKGSAAAAAMMQLLIYR